MREVYKEDIEKYGIETKGCPRKIYRKYYDVTNRTIDIDKVRSDNITKSTYNNEIPSNCDGQEVNGCCIKATPDKDEDLCPKEHSMGLKYLIDGQYITIAGFRTHSRLYKRK